jgi:hypothetical protein
MFHGMKAIMAAEARFGFRKEIILGLPTQVGAVVTIFAAHSSQGQVPSVRETLAAAVRALSELAREQRQ